MERKTKTLLRDKAAVRSFLERHAAALDKTLHEHKRLCAQQPSDRLMGQIRYFENAARAIKWLLAVNEQRS